MLFNTLKQRYNLYKMHKAVMESNPIKIEKLLNDVGLNQTIDGYTVLQHAVINKDKSIVKLLCENNIALNTTSEDNYTALHLAVSKNYLDIAKCILKYKADLNLANKLGDTPLHTAVYNKNISMVMLLLDNKASPQIKNLNGQTVIEAIHMSPIAQILQKSLNHKLWTTNKLAQELEPRQVKASPLPLTSGNVSRKLSSFNEVTIENANRNSNNKEKDNTA